MEIFKMMELMPTKRTLTASSYGTFENNKTLSENSLTLTFKSKAAGNLKDGLGNSVDKFDNLNARITQEGKYKITNLVFEKFPILDLDPEYSWFTQFTLVKK
jgi:hypothetical protein